MTDETGLAIRHDAAAQRFVAQVDGHQAELDYELAQGVVRIVHTGVPAAIGGRGVAADLVRNALEFARAQGYKVRPDCAYAAAYFQRHPEQQDLLG
ncbi:MAG TPA: GNAT family N-acetyltransferase [Stenotrophomonas sp.]|nr:GNAT family N-acetyltransferase [Stenotrophomonas sp.]